MKKSAYRILLPLFLATISGWFGQNALGQTVQSWVTDYDTLVQTVTLYTYDDGSWVRATDRVYKATGNYHWAIDTSDGYESEGASGTDSFGHAYFWYRNNRGNEYGYSYYADGTLYQYSNNSDARWTKYSYTDGSSYERYDDSTQWWCRYVNADGTVEEDSGSYAQNLLNLSLEDLGNVKVTPSP